MNRYPRDMHGYGPNPPHANWPGGAHVAVEALMGPGVDPHLYSPVASDVRKLKNADAIFYNGLHLEGRGVLA